jgi:hypothetical protein
MYNKHCIKQMALNTVWRSHSGGHEEFHILEYDAA